MQGIIDMLKEDSSITTISFPELPFWGSFDYIVDGIFLRHRYSEVHRLFKWGVKYEYLTHRPVTIVNEEGIDLREVGWLRANDLRKKGIFLYHYYKLFPDQVSSKMVYYANLVGSSRSKIKMIENSDEYYNKTFLKLENTFRIHTINKWPSWLVKFHGDHPERIKVLQNDIVTGEINTQTRDMNDVDVLVKTIHYRAGILFWRMWGNYVSQSNWLLRDLLKRRIGIKKFILVFLQIISGKKTLFQD